MGPEGVERVDEGVDPSDDGVKGVAVVASSSKCWAQTSVKRETLISAFSARPPTYPRIRCCGGAPASVVRRCASEAAPKVP